MNSTLKRTYRLRYDSILVPAAAKLDALLNKRLREAKVARVDRIYARAKGVKSFLEKAAKKEKGKRKYPDPVTQIHDQIAARIIVLFPDDVEPTAAVVLRYFARAEQVTKEPESDWAFGYFGVHLLLPLPIEVLPEGIDEHDAPRLFELQIRTLYQHAWSEANHDLGYKPEKPLTPDETRRLAFTSAQSWGADLVFNESHRRQKAGKRGRTGAKAQSGRPI